ncbi:hypothetical protein HZA33_01035 [Candidatus Pacearchaeota archaeon]|nr:hypothetical protein [Candidatus Pacearchaeota archaeon]
MDYKPVEFYDYQNTFSCKGNSFIHIDKEEKIPHGRFHRISCIFSVWEKLVDGFRIEEENNLRVLYLHWHDECSNKKTLIGKIINEKEANEWIKKVNSLYDSVEKVGLHFKSASYRT